jgi:hypothetical protein
MTSVLANRRNLDTATDMHQGEPHRKAELHCHKPKSFRNWEKHLRQILPYASRVSMACRYPGLEPPASRTVRINSCCENY